MAICLLAVGASAGCGGDKEAQGAAAGGGGKRGGGDTAGEEQTPSIRTTLASYRPLLDETGRAELDVGGALVDFGSSDQHKYTRGGWKTGWTANEVGDDGVSFSGINGKSASLDALVHSGPIHEIVLRGRSSASGQIIRVLVDGKGAGNGELGSDWGLVRIPLSEPIAAGRHEVTFLVDKASANGPRAVLDWAWLRTAEGAADPLIAPRVLPVRLGGKPRRSLPAPTPRTYSFYLTVPDKAALVFDYGGKAATDFSVWADVEGAEPAKLWSAKAKPDAWSEAKVELGEHAGKAMRLRLVTENGDGAWGEPELMLPEDAVVAYAEDPATARPKNVVFILIDTVRADMFAAFDEGNEVDTPAYDALAQNSLVFTAAYDNENWTKPSVATTLTGLYPTTHDTKTDPAVLPDAIEILPQILQKKGFATGGFIANGFVSGKYGFEKGWDAFTNYIRENKKSDAEFVYADALGWIEQQQQAGKPFFAYIQTIDPHVVYRVEREYTKKYHPAEYKGVVGNQLAGQMQADISQGKKKIGEADYEWIRALYYGEVTYHDEHMGKFMAELEKLGVTEDTLVIITNDHGEELNERGRLGHGHSLYEEMIRAPLLFHYPKLFKAGVVEDVVEHVDLTPTILDILGMQPKKDADGLSLMPMLTGRATSRPGYAISEFLDGKRAIRVGDWRMLISSGNWLELYDVSVDPKEKTSRDKDADIALRMAEVYLGEGLASPDKSQRRAELATKRQFEAGTVKMDPELKKQLEALGYFGE